MLNASSLLLLKLQTNLPELKTIFHAQSQSKLFRSGDVGLLLRFVSCFFLTLTVHPAEIKVTSFIPSSSD